LTGSSLGVVPTGEEYDLEDNIVDGPTSQVACGPTREPVIVEAPWTIASRRIVQNK
jgi:hypothetical protein